MKAKSNAVIAGEMQISLPELEILEVYKLLELIHYSVKVKYKLKWEVKFKLQLQIIGQNFREKLLNG